VLVSGGLLAQVAINRLVRDRVGLWPALFIVASIVRARALIVSA
jgi:hypothetical protein